MMTPERQIQQRQADWEQLETLIDAINRDIRQLSAGELHELGLLYRQACTDLAVARRDYPDHELTTYLNQLVARGHGVIYRYSARERNRVVDFFRSTLPQTFRATWPMTIAAMLLFLIPAMIAFVTAYRDPTLGEAILPGIDGIVDQIQRGEEWWQQINHVPSASSAEIMTNNINVAIRAFAGGVTLGIYTLYILVYNGLLLGIIAGIAQRLDFAANLWNFVTAHVTLELSAIFIAGSAGLQLGWAILRPGIYSRRGALVRAARRAVTLLIGCTLILIVAGLIEAFISPTNLPLWFKIVISLGSGALLYAYLLLAGDPLPTNPDRSDHLTGGSGGLTQLSRSHHRQHPLDRSAPHR